MSSQEMPRTLKGFRDFLPARKAARDHVEGIVARTFRRFGFQPIETPTLEYAGLIMGKYGEEADRLVYTFEDRGGRRVALPYDQTVPTARVLAQYRNELPRFFRRYSIRDVFRAERPQKGRYREFKQCDIDIYGTRSPVADAEILACTHAAFEAVGFRGARIRLNDRRILMDALAGFATASVDVFSIIRSIDKLDKVAREGVLAELEEKGVSAQSARDALDRVLAAEPDAALGEVMRCAYDLGVPESALEFSPMLARGLDYYTGSIYEVVDDAFPAGSLAGGGRYDDLIADLGGPDVPAVGIAFGFDRMVDAALELDLLPPLHGAAQVLVALFDEATRPQALAAARIVREAGIDAEVHPEPGKLGRQLKTADQQGIAAVVVVGPDEASAGKATVRDMKTGEQTTVPREELAEAVARVIGA